MEAITIKKGIFQKFAFLSLFLTFGVACIDNAQDPREQYSAVETQTEQCLNEWFEAKGVSWPDLMASFEGYFARGGISKAQDPREQQYLDILAYLERPTSAFPVFTDKQKVMTMMKQLGVTEKELMLKAQLDCFTNLFMQQGESLDSTTVFYTIGSLLETMTQVPNISPGLVAGAIKRSLKPGDLRKPVYQKTIVLLYYFDFTLFLSANQYIWIRENSISSA